METDDGIELKRTNEIKMAIPLRDAIDIEGKDVTAHLRRTQRKWARYLVKEHHAHYHFTVKRNQRSVAQKKRELTRNGRFIFDYRRMTKNSCTAAYP